MERRSRNSLLWSLVGVFLSTAVALAQGAISDPGPPAEPTPGNVPDYGTAGLTSYTVSAIEFSTYSQGDTWSPVAGTPNRYLTSGYFEVALHFPNGARIESIQIEGCDTSASGELNAFLLKATQPAGGGSGVVSLGTGVAETPGCGQFSKALPAPVTVDNANDRYFFQLSGTGLSFTSYAAVRAFYRLQVTPAPAVATFSDVPTGHPFFRFVEALAAAGITGGCGTGIYCPDNPVTRGQMAVFLSVALGLHFPN